MQTQTRQPVSASRPPLSQATRYARLRTLIESIAAMYIVALLTGYALIKILQSQFANRLDPFQTELRLAEFSRSSLFWITYAQAPMYETLLGLIEAACVLLVFFRRTRPIGAVLTLAVMSNLAAMNAYFDISAKLNAFSLAGAALILVLLFMPTYRRWIDARAEAQGRFAFGAGARKVGLVLKTLALVVPTVNGLVLLKTLISPLASPGVLYGKWLVEDVDGTVPSANGVAPLAPSAIVMFNKMGVLAVRSGESMHFGRYVEHDSTAIIELALYRITNEDRIQLPPPGRFEERARALAAFPLGYQLPGSFERLSDDHLVLQLMNSGEPLRLSLRRFPDRIPLR
jgi:hypothetical protein